MDFSKELLTATALQIPENGTAAEQTAMQYHGTRNHPSTTQEGIASNFITNHPQLLRYDLRKSNGVNVGLNPLSTISPNDSITYKWYAGMIVNWFGQIVGVPVKFGATNLSPSDPIKHASKGAIGALIIEPRNSTWTVDTNSRAAASITKNDGTGEIFREFVTFFQNNLNLRMSKNVNDKEDIADWSGSTNIPSDARSLISTTQTVILSTRRTRAVSAPITATTR